MPSVTGMGAMLSTTKEHLTHPSYRPDLDGLRAVAVLSVVGFHAFPNQMKGGFVGVDIFFVISGFLISTIIFSSLDRKAFSFSEFYLRRVRRIFPALLAVLVTCFVLGWFVLFSDEYKQLGKHILGGAGFVSNFILWHETGYFDSAADTKPLLHLWSLGIEEQFYIIWPLLLWYAWKIRWNPLALTTSIALASFIFNLVKVRGDVVAGFYSPQTRFWELLSGAALAYINLNKVAFSAATIARHRMWMNKIFCFESRYLHDTQSVIGAIFITLSIIMTTKEKPFPGYWAVLPVLGAILVIAAGKHALLNRTILSNRNLVWIGLISFPLYLWHWPLLTFVRTIEGGAPSYVSICLVLLGSLLLAWLTYEFLEKPLRFGQHGVVKGVVLVSLMALVGSIGYYTYMKGGFEFRVKEREEFLSYFDNARPEMHYFQKIEFFSLWRPECSYFDLQKYREFRLDGDVINSRPRDTLDKSCYERNYKYQRAVLLWGDSHAQQLVPGLMKNLPNNWQLLQVTSSACLPNADVTAPSSSSQCKQSNYFALRTIVEARPDVVILAQASWHNKEKLLATSEKLKELGVGRIVLVGPVPQWVDDLPKLIARRLWLTKPIRSNVGIDKKIFQLNEQLQRDLEPYKSIHYANMIGALCNSDGCLLYLGEDIKRGIVSWDRSHLTPVASDFVARELLVDVVTRSN